jgi:hypothetical protein
LNDIIILDLNTQFHSRVEKKRDENIRICLDWDQFTPLLNQKMLLLSPFCGHPECEKRIKDQSTREEPVEEVDEKEDANQKNQI